MVTQLYSAQIGVVFTNIVLANVFFEILVVLMPGLGLRLQRRPHFFFKATVKAKNIIPIPLPSEGHIRALHIAKKKGSLASTIQIIVVLYGSAITLPVEV